MPSAYVSPGMYVVEDDQSLFVPALAATPFGTVGCASWGPVNEPTLITSQEQLYQTFGDLTGASAYVASTPQYPKHPMVYALARYLRRGRAAVVVRVGNSSLAKATGYLAGERSDRLAPSINTTQPFVAAPSAPTCALQAGGNLPIGVYRVSTTWVTANGETVASAETTGATTTTNSGNTTIRVTIGTFANTGETVVGANIYITQAGGASGTGRLVKYATAPGTVDITDLPVDTSSNVYKLTARYNGTYGNRLLVGVDEGSNWTYANPTRKVTLYVKSPIDDAKIQQLEVYDALKTDPTNTSALSDDVLYRMRDGVSAFFTVGLISVPTANTAGTSTPPTPAGTPTTGGTLAAGTYSFTYTYVTASGESLPATANTVSITGANNAFTFTASSIPASPVVTKLNVYLSPSGGSSNDTRLTMSYPVSANTHTVTVTQLAGAQKLAYSPTSAPHVTLSGGHDGTPASSDNDYASTFIGAGASNGVEPTGLQLFRNTEAVQVGLIAAPGISHTSVVSELIDIAAVSRGDCLALIDPPPALTPDQIIKWHNGSLGTSGAPQSALNSSYAALFWPWVQLFDGLNSQDLYVPPSAFAAETIAYTDFVSEQWYAPAGLNRGVLTNVKKAQYRPTQGERDILYSGTNAVNPITTFAANGIVVWGQRTLQRTPTALDRINVRRLLIYVRQRIRETTLSLVFEPNDTTMWRKFINTVSPLLQGIKNGRGITDFKVQMDASTNPPEIVEQNQAVAKVFIKPTKAAEIIVVKLITTSQASNFDEEVVTTGSVNGI